MSGPLHLARRFLGSLSPRPLAAADHAWVRETLGAGERQLWDRMPLADRKHAAGVAREVDQRLDHAAPAVLAAALLHDVGKIESGLGTFGRVVATVVAGVVGRERASAWTQGWRGRVGAYLRHPEIGAGLLEAHGADPLTVTWAAEHHRPRERWSVPRTVADALHAADDD